MLAIYRCTEATAVAAGMWIDTDSARLHTTVAGQGSPALVLVHGLGGSSQSWASTAEGFAAAWRTLAPDLRGCGLSERGSKPYTLDLLADDIVRVLDVLQEERVHLVGHSLGGVVCQSVLTRHNDRCASAVLVGTSSRVGQRAREAWQQLAEVVEDGGLSRAGAGAARAFSPAFARANPQVVETHARLAARSDPFTYAAQARIASDYDYTAALSAVNQPVLVVHGLADQLTSPGGSVILHRALANARLEMIDGVGHNAHTEMGQGFVTLVNDFLQANNSDT